jgi:hypothetical protein
MSAWKRFRCLIALVGCGSLLLPPTVARADFFDKARDFFGISSGAEKVQQGMVELSLNMRETTNQLGALVADLHSGDSARAKRARSIFAGILGQPPAAGETPSIGLSVQLVTRAKQEPGRQQAPKPYSFPLHIDVWPAGTEANIWVEARFVDGKNPAFIHNPINVSRAYAETPEELRARIIKKAIDVERDGRASRCFAKQTGGFGTGPVNNWCLTEVEAEGLADVVMTLLPSFQETPAGTVYTHTITGGYFAAILGKKPQLDALLKANPDAMVEAWVHNMAPPKKRLAAFATANWNMPVSDWVKRCYDTKTDGAGVICYAFVDLKVATMSEYYLYIEELRKRAPAAVKAGS